MIYFSPALNFDMPGAILLVIELVRDTMPTNIVTKFEDDLVKTV